MSADTASGMGRRTWRAGRSDWKLHALTVFSLAVAFVCLASALLVVSNVERVRDRWSHAGRATVYLRDDVPDEQVAELVRALSATEGVQRVRHVTSAEARREVMASADDRALAALPLSAFPASLEVGFTEAIGEAELESIALKLRSLPQVETVETYERWTERLSALLGGGVTASACLALIVLCAVVSVIGSTMRLLLHRRRMEVTVLKLVGASDPFVRRPFVIEAAAQGAAGAGAAIAVLGALFLIVTGRFDHQLSDLLGVAPAFLPWQMALAMVALGAGLGAATALLTLRKMANV